MRRRNDPRFIVLRPTSFQCNPHGPNAVDLLAIFRPTLRHFIHATSSVRTKPRHPRLANTRSAERPAGGRGDPRASLTMFRAAIIGVSTNQSLCEQLTHGFLDFNPGRHTRRRPARRSRLDTPRFGQVVIKLSQMFGHRVTCFTQVCRFESNPYLAPSTELRACIIGHTSMEIQ